MDDNLERDEQEVPEGYIEISPIGGNALDPNRAFYEVLKYDLGYPVYIEGQRGGEIDVRVSGFTGADKAYVAPEEVEKVQRLRTMFLNFPEYEVFRLMGMGRTDRLEGLLFGLAYEVPPAWVRVEENKNLVRQVLKATYLLHAEEAQVRGNHDLAKSNKEKARLIKNEALTPEELRERIAWKLQEILEEKPSLKPSNS